MIYLIVLLIPSVLVIILTYINDIVGKNETESSYQHTFSQIQISLDSRFQDIMEMGEYIATDKSLGQLIDIVGSLNADDIYNYTQLIDSLKTYNLNNFVIHDFLFIFLEMNDLLHKGQFITKLYFIIMCIV